MIGGLDNKKLAGINYIVSQKISVETPLANTRGKLECLDNLIKTQAKFDELLAECAGLQDVPLTKTPEHVLNKAHLIAQSLLLNPMGFKAGMMFILVFNNEDINYIPRVISRKSGKLEFANSLLSVMLFGCVEKFFRWQGGIDKQNLIYATNTTEETSHFILVGGDIVYACSKLLEGYLYLRDEQDVLKLSEYFNRVFEPFFILTTAEYQKYVRARY